MRAIWHIDHGSRGTAGAYVDALLTASHKAGIKSYAFVSWCYAFPTKGVIRFFYPFTDRTEKRNKLIMIIRGLELMAGYLFIFLAALVMRPVITLHLAGYAGGVFALFCALKATGIRVYVTCHDVAERNLEMSKQRLYLLRKADKLIVHSSAAQDMLFRYLGNRAAKLIERYPFPFSPYDTILCSEKMVQAVDSLNRVLGGKDVEYFLFTSPRQCKEIDTLIEAWGASACKKSHILLMAGKWNNDIPKTVEERARELENCIVINRHLTDEEFVQFIMRAKFNVLPYLNYSHSSVLISCARLESAVVISDIDLFKDYFDDYDLTFPSGDSKSLACLLDKAAGMSEEEVRTRAQLLKCSVERHDEELIERLHQAYGDSSA